MHLQMCECILGRYLSNHTLTLIINQKYLATGESFRSLFFSFEISHSYNFSPTLE